MKWSILSLLVACGGSAPSPPSPPTVVHVEPVAIVDAGPKCVEAIDEPPPKWTGTYPKTLPRFTMNVMGERQKALLPRDPDLEGFLFDERGFIYGFLTTKLPYEESEMTIPFLTAHNDVLADAQSILADLRCRNPDIAHFEATRAWIGKSTHHSLIFERKQVFDDLTRDEPLPPPLDDDKLLSKWNLGVEVARVHQIVVHHPGQRCVGTSTQPCDPIGPRDETIDKRVVVGTVPVAKKYLRVNVTRASYRRATTFELRLVARVEVRWPELQADVTPRFGASLEPQITGNLQEVFDAVTGDPFNPYAP